MPIKFKTTDKRLESNQVEKKVILRKNWYAVGTDGKQSFLTKIDNALGIEARTEAKLWAKKNGLKLEVVNVSK
jgi:hypothetical protein